MSVERASLTYLAVHPHGVPPVHPVAKKETTMYSTSPFLIGPPPGVYPLISLPPSPTTGGADRSTFRWTFRWMIPTLVTSTMAR